MDKLCSRCKLEKELGEFYRSKYGKYGKRGECKQCSSIYDSQHHQKNKAEDTIKYREYQRIRRKTDLSFRLRKNVRTRLCAALINGQKSGSAVRDLGCSVDALKRYLESQFQPGMSWDNWGFGQDKWHIDHIVPLSQFDLTDREQFLKACHYSNLQPLWHNDNMKKGSKR